MAKKRHKKTKVSKEKYESPEIEKIRVSSTYKLSLTATTSGSGPSSFGG